MSRISFFLILLIAVPVFSTPFIIGHNLGITTDVPEKGTATFGSYIAGYSFSDDCIVGTNTWMAWNYNSYSLIGRCKIFSETKYVDESTIQLAYIKSDRSLGKFYRQDVALAWWAFKNKFNDLYTVFTTINYMYFWDETLPFSLRREPGNGQPYQFSLTTLHQVRLTESLGFHFELGILGLNYSRPLSHSGYSIYKKWDSFFLQAGMSISASANNMDRLYSKTNASNMAPESYDYSMHPEIQLQYFF